MRTKNVLDIYCRQKGFATRASLALALLLLSVPGSSSAMKLPPSGGWRTISPQGKPTSEEQAHQGPRIETPQQAKRVLPELASKPSGGVPEALSATARSSIERVYTEPGKLPQLEVDIEGENLPLPLEHTHVKAELTGYVARVEVTQTYSNPFEYPIEALYVFPLPENSAVDDMRIVIGERVIEAEIKRREQARQEYEQAKNEGYTAALLEQERPNIFTQSIANIAPGNSIDVVVRYQQTLSYDAGEYEFVFPMVVGPRFIPGKPLQRPQSGRGYARDTDTVPDASRISPPILGAGTRSGHDISLELVATAALPIARWEAVTHQVDVSPTLDGSLALTLTEKDSLPNRDFVLRYEVDGDEPRATLLTHRADEGGFLSLVIHPPKLDVEELVGRREIIFVVDISGSMSGVPLLMCQEAMKEALGGLRPVDTFNVITFAGRTGKAFEEPRPANQTNVEDALRFIGNMRAGGGTHMLNAVEAALKSEVEEGRHRYVFFLTDGYVGNETQIFAASRDLVATLADRGQRAKVFGFGVGSSVNRHLLEGLASAGNGVSVYATTREDPRRAVQTFYRYIDHPVISDVQIDWGGLPVEQQIPTRVGDLLASRALIVHARYSAPAEGTIYIKGRAGDEQVELPVEVRLPERKESDAALATLWARAEIGRLRRELWNGPSQQVAEKITELGLRFRIVTKYTSFVAVDRSQRVSDGRPVTVVQPIEAPEGVNPIAAGARTVKRKAMLNIAPAPASRGFKGGGMPTLRPLAEDKALAQPAPPRPEPKARASNRQSARDSARQSEQTGGAVSSSLPRAMRKALTQLKKELLESKDARAAKGELVVRFFVTRTGDVIQLKVKRSTLGNRRVERLLVERIASWKLPPHRGAPIEVVLPLELPLR